MYKIIYDWFELERLEKAAIEGEVLDIDLAEIRRNKMIMYLCYFNHIDRMKAKEGVPFWDAVARIDETRAGLVERFGLETVMEVERCSVETAMMIEDIDATMNATWDMFAPPMRNQKVDEKGNIVQDDSDDVNEPDSLYNLAKRLNFTDKHIAALGLAACALGEVTGDVDREPDENPEQRASINYEEFANKLINRKDPFDPRLIVKLHNLAGGALREALKAYEKGDPSKLGRLVKAGIRKTCEMFADARDPKDAAKRSAQLKEMLEVVEVQPKLKEAVNLSPEENNSAYGAVIMGETVTRGLRSLNKLQTAGLANTEVSEKIKTECMTDILQMQIVLNDRNQQIEVFKDTSSLKLPPSDMQRTMGAGASVTDIKKGKWPQHVKNLRTGIARSNSFRTQAKQPMFLIAHQLGSEKRRMTITHSAMLDMQTEKLVPQTPVKKTAVQPDLQPAKKSVQQPGTMPVKTEPKPPVLGGPVLGGPSTGGNNKKDRK